MQAIGADPDEFHRVDFYSSHEALLLEYEHALTRIDSRTGRRTTCPATSSGSASGPGSSTARTSSCCRHIRNPIGVKLGPTTTRRRRARAGRAARPRQRARPADLHHPDGRGPDPRRAARAGGEGHRGRRRRSRGCATRCTATLRGAPGYKTRRFDDVIAEVQGFFDVHRALGHLARRHPRRAHRRRRHRVRRRGRGAARGRPRATATSRSATRGSTGCSRSSWRSWSPRCCARPRRPVELATV